MFNTFVRVKSEIVDQGNHPEAAAQPVIEVRWKK